MQISERIQELSPSATLAMSQKSAELKAAGIDVINMSVGEPDFDTPAHIKEGAKRAIDENFSRYTPVAGYMSLRRAISRKLKEENALEFPPEQIVVGNGAKQELCNVVLATVNPGDEVVIPVPAWVSYVEMEKLAGGRVVTVHAGVEQNFKVTPEQLEAAITPRTRLVMLNSPSNPTGACYSVPERDAIVKWALDRGLFIIADEIYDQLVYEPNKPSSIIVWWKQYPDRIAVVNGLAKSFAMTGWRVGYTVAHPDLIKKLSQITGQATGNICSVSQKAAVAALTGPYDCVESMRRAFQKRRDMAWKEIASWPKVVCPKPEGAFYLFADISARTRLLSEAGVALVPGDAFGAPDCIRFSYAVADDVLMDALARVRKVLIGQ